MRFLFLILLSFSAMADECNTKYAYAKKAGFIVHGRIATLMYQDDYSQSTYRDEVKETRDYLKNAFLNIDLALKACPKSELSKVLKVKYHLWDLQDQLDDI